MIFGDPKCLLPKIDYSVATHNIMLAAQVLGN
jgi:hypothetical protein